MSIIHAFLRDEEGATAIEYALIAGSISIAIVAAVASVGTSLQKPFTTLATALK
jgi:pilus assembly protein Flp/PilA